MEQQFSEKSSVSVSLVIGIVTLVAVMFAAYNALDKRVAAMEEKTNRVQSDLVEIKGDLKTLLRLQR